MYVEPRKLFSQPVLQAFRGWSAVFNYLPRRKYNGESTRVYTVATNNKQYYTIQRKRPSGEVTFNEGSEEEVIAVAGE